MSVHTARSYEEWKRLGFIINKGQRARHWINGVALFEPEQVNGFTYQKVNTTRETTWRSQEARKEVTVETEKEVKVEKPETITTKKVIAYTDGSGKGSQCGWGTVLIDGEDGSTLGQYKGNLGPQRNGQIAGEVEAAIFAIRYAHCEPSVESLQIMHDYTGIAMWPTRRWKAKDPDAIRLIHWYEHATANGLKIGFTWTKGHSGTEGNEMADYLAGYATTLPPRGKIPTPPSK